MRGQRHIAIIQAWNIHYQRKTLKFPKKKDSEQARELENAQLNLVGMCAYTNISSRQMTIIVKTLRKSDKQSKIWHLMKLGKKKPEILLST